MKALFPAVVLVAASFPAFAQDADALVRGVRLAAAVQKSDLEGSIRKGNAKTRVMLFLKEKNIQFLLGPDDTTDRFHIRMNDDKCDLLEIGADGKTSTFPASKLVSSLAGTDLTYEDLTLRFLYWPNAKLEGEEKIAGQDCYKVRLDNPGKDGAFGSVYVWIHKTYGAFWTIRAYDRKGKPLKEFQVKSVMQLPDGSYTLQQMQIATLDNEGRASSLSYLEFNKPKKADKKKGIGK